MSTYAVTDSQLTAIADEIRLKRDTSEEYTIDDMPLAISLIEGGGGSGDALYDVVSTEVIPESANEPSLIASISYVDEYLKAGSFSLSDRIIVIIDNTSTSTSRNMRLLDFKPSSATGISLSTIYKNGAFGYGTNYTSSGGSYSCTSTRVCTVGANSTATVYRLKSSLFTS